MTDVGMQSMALDLAGIQLISLLTSSNLRKISEYVACAADIGLKRVNCCFV
jgi:hypothetical protein